MEGITKTVSEAIRILDTSVFGPTIGGYEILHEYSVWLATQMKRHKSVVMHNLESEFRDHIGKEFGRTPGGQYCASMVDYDDNLR
ncbi:MAG TPA: hypothetical protein VMB73_20835 [Acetobacteraceae bacterium]|nr:hypothetical protein [Acetobacteraceae bacterium]